MAKGLDKIRARKEAMSLLGKDLARRARSKCELCEGHEGKLTPFEPEPVPDDPSLEQTMLLCPRCTAGAAGGELENPSSWRHLETVVWAELPVMQVTAIRMLRRLSAAGTDWATEALDSVYPSDETLAWLDG